MGRAQSRMNLKSVDLPIIHKSFKSSGGEVMEHTDHGISMPFCTTRMHTFTVSIPETVFLMKK